MSYTGRSNYVTRASNNTLCATPKNQDEVQNVVNAPAAALERKPIEVQESEAAPAVEQVKEEVSVNSDSTQQNENSMPLYDGNGKLHFRNIFKSRKKPSVRAKEKKLRQNRQLRRSLLPKNALMALNEVKGISISEFTFTTNESGGFTAHVTVNGKQHEGKGNSKIAAKNSASESALRDFVIAKMLERPRPTKRNKTNSQSDAKAEPMEVAECDETCSNAESQHSLANQDDADDLPMMNLASFALYKLFSDWERDGFTVPELHPNSDINNENDNSSVSEPAAPKEPKKPSLRTELPNNWDTMHPATVLCMMRPGLTYTDYGSIGEKNEKLHRIGVVIDGTEFIENGRSKKVARRNVAVTVCNVLFGTNFVKDEGV